MITVKQIVDEGGHKNHPLLTDSRTLKLVKEIVREMTVITKINLTCVGYDGVDRNEDLILWLNAIKERYLTSSAYSNQFEDNRPINL